MPKLKRVYMCKVISTKYFVEPCRDASKKKCKEYSKSICNRSFFLIPMDGVCMGDPSTGDVDIQDYHFDIQSKNGWRSVDSNSEGTLIWLPAKKEKV